MYEMVIDTAKIHPLYKLLLFQYKKKVTGMVALHLKRGQQQVIDMRK